MPDIVICCNETRLAAEIEKALKPLIFDGYPDYRLHALASPASFEKTAESMETALLVLCCGQPEKTFNVADELWEKWSELSIVYVAKEAQEVFAALARPFFHVVRGFALEQDMGAVMKKLERQRPRLPEMIAFSCGTQLMRLSRRNILYVESDRHEITIHLTGQSVVTTDTLGECAERLHGFGFVRIHKSYLVNLYHVSRLEKGSLLLSDGQRLYISRYRYPEVRLELESYIRRLDFMD